MHQKGKERGRVKNEHNTAAQHAIMDEVDTLAYQEKKIYAFKYTREKDALHTHARRGRTQTSRRTRDKGGEAAANHRIIQTPTKDMCIDRKHGIGEEGFGAERGREREGKSIKIHSTGA